MTLVRELPLPPRGLTTTFWLFIGEAKASAQLFRLPDLESSRGHRAGAGQKQSAPVTRWPTSYGSASRMIEGRLAPPQFIQSAKSRYPHRKIDILAFMRNGRARLPVGCETRNLA